MAAPVGRNDPCPCGSGQKYKKCHGSIKSDAEVLKTAQARGFRVSQDFKDRVQCKRIGPIIKGEWRVDPKAEERLKSKGSPVPEPVKGYFLIDTGASETSIDGGVVKELNLTLVARTRAAGLGGVGIFDKYCAQMLLYVGDIHGNNVAIGLWKDLICAPRLRELHDAYGLKASDGSPLRIIGLLGRDFLQFTTLTYRGLVGSWDMEIDPGVMRPWEAG